MLTTHATVEVLIDTNLDGSFGEAAVVPKEVAYRRGRNADSTDDAEGSFEFTLNDTDGSVSAAIPLGAPVLIRGTDTNTSTVYPCAYGYVDRVAPNANLRETVVTCLDPLRRLDEIDVVVAANTFVSRSARDCRLAILEDALRGTLNLVGNPSFETDTTGWAGHGTGGSFARIGTDHAGTGSACLEFTPSGVLAQGVRYAVRLAPVVFAGQVYRGSLYLKSPSGSATWTMALLDSTLGVIASRDVLVTTAWVRWTLTATVAATVSANTANGPLLLAVYATNPSMTLRVDQASVTRGQGAYPYADVGTGRWPNYCGNGGFDGAALNGWYDGVFNFCTNGNFETDTSGWVVTADAFHAAGTSITRTAGTLASGGVGSWHADVLVGAGTSPGAHMVLSGTFKQGVTYRVRAAITNGSGNTVRLGIGSQGTPADKAELNHAPGFPAGTWTVDWVPSGDRTDAHVYTNSNAGGTWSIDALIVCERDPAMSGDLTYFDTGPGTGGHRTDLATRPTTTTSFAKYGSRSQQWLSVNLAGSGRMYDFSHLGGYFLAGQAYEISLWLYPSSDMPYKVGLASNLGTGAFEDTSTTGTATNGQWNQVTLTVTPAADRSSLAAFTQLLYIHQTDTTVRTVRLDGVRVIPGNAADDFEPLLLSMTAGVESEPYSTSASFSGSALSALGSLNGLTLSRHVAKPSLTTPFWSYVVEGRDEYASKSSSETFTNDFSGMESVEKARDSIVNVVPISYVGAVEYYSDEASVTAYGPHPGQSIAGTSFFTTRAVPDALGLTLLTRYKDPRARPTLTVKNQFPRQLVREVGDLVTVTLTRLGISSKDYLILSLETKITDGGRAWTTSYVLEEKP